MVGLTLSGRSTAARRDSIASRGFVRNIGKKNILMGSKLCVLFCGGVSATLKTSHWMGALERSKPATLRRAQKRVRSRQERSFFIGGSGRSTSILATPAQYSHYIADSLAASPRYASATSLLRKRLISHILPAARQPSYSRRRTSLYSFLPLPCQGGSLP